MDAEVRLLFHELVDLSPAERERILAERRVGADVRAEVESLLDFHSADALTGCIANAAAKLHSCATTEPSHCGQYGCVANAKFPAPFSTGNIARTRINSGFGQKQFGL